MGSWHDFERFWSLLYTTEKITKNPENIKIEILEPPPPPFFFNCFFSALFILVYKNCLGVMWKYALTVYTSYTVPQTRLGILSDCSWSVLRLLWTGHVMEWPVVQRKLLCAADRCHRCFITDQDLVTLWHRQFVSRQGKLGFSVHSIFKNFKRKSKIVSSLKNRKFRIILKFLPVSIIFETSEIL